ncbi:MAG TPA: ABC transporter permease, partial [Thermoanaerobaculia bacterium]|nr:ABC transporter permease [Thermoanaerobaculia bacterium]
MTGRGFPLYVAVRYLRSTRRDAFTSFLSGVAIGGIGLGVAALVLALGALAGMQRALRSEILARTPSLAVTLPPAADLLAIESELGAEPEVTAVQRILSGRGWLVGEGRALPVELVGFEGAVPASFPGAGGAFPGLYVADADAARLGLRPGSVVTLAAPRPTLTPLGPQPRMLSMRVEGVFQASRADELSRVALPIERAEILLGGERPRRLEVTARDLDAALALAARWSDRLPPGSRLETWKDLNRPLFLALALERTVLFLAVSLVVAVAAIALVSDLQLVAVTKRRELAVLVALGADPRSLRRVFLLLGGLLGGLGAVGGGALGWAAAVAAD